MGAGVHMSNTACPQAVLDLVTAMASGPEKLVTAARDADRRCWNGRGTNNRHCRGQR